MITLFPSKRSADRKRRLIDFVNKMKVLMRKTKPILEDENEEDAEWLEKWETDLPEEAVASVAVVEEEEGTASPLRQVLRNAIQAITGKRERSGNPFRNSTPELVTKERKEKMNKGGKSKTKKGKKSAEQKAEIPPLDLEEKIGKGKKEEVVHERLMGVRESFAQGPNTLKLVRQPY